jgi:hypothetical protein
MDGPRMIWLTGVAAAVSAIVSVVTACVVVPMVVGERAVAEKPAEVPSTAPPRGTLSPESLSPESLSPLSEGVFATGNDPRQAQIEAAQDREAVAAIKDKLGIDLFSGTLLDEGAADSGAGNELAEEPTHQQVAVDALIATAERLKVAGQMEAAELVRAAADRLRGVASRSATIDGASKPR